MADVTHQVEMTDAGGSVKQPSADEQRSLFDRIPILKELQAKWNEAVGTMTGGKWTSMGFLGQGIGAARMVTGATEKVNEWGDAVKEQIGTAETWVDNFRNSPAVQDVLDATNVDLIKERVGGVVEQGEDIVNNAGKMVRDGYAQGRMLLENNSGFVVKRAEDLVNGAKSMDEDAVLRGKELYAGLGDKINNLPFIPGMPIDVQQLGDFIEGTKGQLMDAAFAYGTGPEGYVNAINGILGNVGLDEVGNVVLQQDSGKVASDVFSGITAGVAASAEAVMDVNPLFGDDGHISDGYVNAAFTQSELYMYDYLDDVYGYCDTEEQTQARYNQFMSTASEIAQMSPEERAATPGMIMTDWNKGNPQPIDMQFDENGMCRMYEGTPFEMSIQRGENNTYSCTSEYMGDFTFSGNDFQFYSIDVPGGEGSTKPILRCIRPECEAYDPSKEMLFPGIAGPSAFANSNDIHIPDGIKHIDHMFENTAIKGIPRIPDSVLSGHDAFRNSDVEGLSAEYVAYAREQQPNGLDLLLNKVNGRETEFSAWPKNCMDFSGMFYSCDNLQGRHTSDRKKDEIGPRAGLGELGYLPESTMTTQDMFDFTSLEPSDKVFSHCINLPVTACDSMNRSKRAAENQEIRMANAEAEAYNASHAATIFGTDIPFAAQMPLIPVNPMPTEAQLRADAMAYVRDAEFIQQTTKERVTDPTGWYFRQDNTDLSNTKNHDYNFDAVLVGSEASPVMDQSDYMIRRYDSSQAFLGMGAEERCSFARMYATRMNFDSFLSASPETIRDFSTAITYGLDADEAAKVHQAFTDGVVMNMMKLDSIPNTVPPYISRDRAYDRDRAFIQLYSMADAADIDPMSYVRKEYGQPYDTFGEYFLDRDRVTDKYNMDKGFMRSMNLLDYQQVATYVDTVAQYAGMAGDDIVNGISDFDRFKDNCVSPFAEYATDSEMGHTLAYMQGVQDVMSGRVHQGETSEANFKKFMSDASAYIDQRYHLSDDSPTGILEPRHSVTERLLRDNLDSVSRWLQGDIYPAWGMYSDYVPGYHGGGGIGIGLRPGYYRDDLDRILFDSKYSPDSNDFGIELDGISSDDLENIGQETDDEFFELPHIDRKPDPDPTRPRLSREQRMNMLDRLGVNRDSFLNNGSQIEVE